MDFRLWIEVDHKMININVRAFTVVCFQAVCKDKLFPGSMFFAKGYGPSDEPYRAYAAAFMIGVGFICMGKSVAKI